MTSETDNATGAGADGGQNGDGQNGRLSSAMGTARACASEAYTAARERTSAAYDTARDSASRATQRTSETVETYPEAALLGGLAIGALLGAVLPRTEKESELLGSTGRRINEAATAAARAAREAARGKLDEVGLSKDAARQKLSDLASSATEVARTSATAAAQAVKGGQAQ